ncbi:hypothetical protein FMEAI12_4630033 [Parafrankia sp. Ea1.12]|nr:hypothetical protein FMEAI12_4630033 [Parafrankia sp. Ea1.12]
MRADWSNQDFAELRTTCATLAIAGTRTVALFAPDAARPSDNRSVTPTATPSTSSPR